jgi:hypothetical protein
VVQLNSGCTAEVLPSSHLVFVSRNVLFGRPRRVHIGPLSHNPDIHRSRTDMKCQPSARSQLLISHLHMNMVMDCVVETRIQLEETLTRDRCVTHTHASARGTIERPRYASTRKALEDTRAYARKNPDEVVSFK